MRESIGGAWLLGIVMTFIVLFASFLAISVNYSKAFKVKNNVVDLIEKHEGMTTETVDAIWNYLEKEGYILKGKCDSGYTAFDRDGKADNVREALYCVKRTDVDSNSTVDKTYYGVEVFFRLDLPVIGDIFTFSVKGETMSIYFAEDDYLSKG